MRTLLSAILIITSSGCLMEVLTVTAIEGELAAEGAKSASRTLDHARDGQAKIELQSAVRSYAGFGGSYPDTLDALVPDYIALVPIQSNGRSFGYNPANGSVFIQRGDDSTGLGPSTAMTQADVQNLEQIRGAIYRYWELTGQYPSSLESLVPFYIKVLPTRVSGEAYLYDVRSGAVNHPAELRRNSATAPRAGVSGADINGISQAHNDRQQKALDDLGF
ncbi:MAG: hypothetical protein VCD00_16920 [Candidatus Hydrogenedentota bacterium]